ncbi:MAG: hypothetical protein WCW66_06935 [Patescibacteria group bacterium]
MKKIFKKKNWVEVLKIWPTVASPCRPSPFDLKIWEKKIQEILRQNKQPKALVFGSTPEIRDLLAKYRISTTILDINPGMVKGLLKLMKYKKQRKEKIIINNWLNINKLFPTGSFDLVLGHCFFNNLPWRLHLKLAKSIHPSLKKDGYLLIVSPILDKEKPLSPKQIISMYRQNPRYFEQFANRWYFSVERLKKLDYNKKTKQIFFSKIKTRLIKEIKKQKLPTEIINKIWPFGVSDVMNNYVTAHPPLKNLVKILKNYFKVEKISFSPLSSGRCCPNFVLKNK